MEKAIPKIKQNVANIEISLNALNYLLGKEDLRTAVEALCKKCGYANETKKYRN